MRIFSFHREGFNLVPFEVEVDFMPGLPSIQIIGQPDQVIKESQLRIKTAIQKQGFIYPKAKQIVVNLKPSYIKKKSQGLDLAIACAYLYASGQVDAPNRDKVFIYGELGLDGCVYMPDDFDFINDMSDQFLLTGFSDRPVLTSYKYLKQLSDLNQPQSVHKSDVMKHFVRPDIKQMQVSVQLIRLLKIIAVGEHSTLFAGPAGSGKSTFAELIPQFLKPPSEEQAFAIQKISRLFKQKQSWRPLVVPHHTIPKISMVGGGSHLVPGEITRAHNGVLLLDELLEFSNQTKEALREPIEKGCVHIARQSKYYKFPSDFLLLATTNLCPCGDMVPGNQPYCRFTLRKCQSYIEKLSGPLLDRFQILSYSQTWKTGNKKDIGSSLDEIKKTFEFIKDQGRENIVNAKLKEEQILCEFTDRSMGLFELMEFKSHRRKLAVMRVARTIADIEMCAKIKFEHIQEANTLCTHPFKDMQRIFE